MTRFYTFLSYLTFWQLIELTGKISKKVDLFILFIIFSGEIGRQNYSENSLTNNFNASTASILFIIII